MKSMKPRSADKSAGKGRPHDAGSTTAILQAALELVAERGYHDATLEEIVARAKSSKPTSHDHRISRDQSYDWQKLSEVFQLSEEPLDCGHGIHCRRAVYIQPQLFDPLLHAAVGQDKVGYGKGDSK